jgi:tetratricopeptide (TPR) repeat protein
MKRVIPAFTLLLALALAAVAQQPDPAAAPPPQGKPRPQAKTQEEYDAFLSAGTTANLAESEAAAQKFAADYPESELRGLLFQNLMHRYQEMDNAAKTIEMGRLALKADPQDPTSAVTVAAVIAERTRQTDLDRDERLAEAVRLSRVAIDNVHTGLIIPPGTPSDRVEEVKQNLLSMAHGTLGTVLMQQNDYSAAEEHLRAAVGYDKAQPDAVLFLRLSVALDHQKKYREGLEAAERALQLASEGPVAALARQQRDRLTKLAAEPAPAPQ